MMLISCKDKIRCFIYSHHRSKFENAKHQLPWNISSRMILMKFIPSYYGLESLHKAIPDKNLVT